MYNFSDKYAYKCVLILIYNIFKTYYKNALAN